MRMLELNHIHDNGASISGYFALALGLLALIAAFGWQQNVSAENELLDASLKIRTSQSLQKELAAGVLVTQPESMATQQAIFHIILPWSELLKGMESIQQNDIRLMSLSPDWKSKRIQMSLLATSREAIWAYMERLRQLGMLKEVKLNTSQSTHLNGMAVVAFEVEALWDI